VNTEIQSYPEACSEKVFTNLQNQTLCSACNRQCRAL